ncbi:MAG: hypothetical protein ACOH1R_01300 [Luteimonas sp.]
MNTIPCGTLRGRLITQALSTSGGMVPRWQASYRSSIQPSVSTKQAQVADRHSRQGLGETRMRAINNEVLATQRDLRKRPGLEAPDSLRCHIALTTSCQLIDASGFPAQP